jgi:DNA topoisomerase-1
LSHLQATGRDAKGRKQYRYHARWAAVRGQQKYDQLLPFADALPAIRRRVSADLKQPPLSQPWVLATVVRILDRGMLRIGNEEYARANGSYGLTTLRNRHVRVRGGRVSFRFRAKSGVLQNIDVADPELARALRRCQELTGPAAVSVSGRRRRGAQHHVDGRERISPRAWPDRMCPPKSSGRGQARWPPRKDWVRNRPGRPCATAAALSSA